MNKTGNYNKKFILNRWNSRNLLSLKDRKMSVFIRLYERSMLLIRQDFQHDTWQKRKRWIFRLNSSFHHIRTYTYINYINVTVMYHSKNHSYLIKELELAEQGLYKFTLIEFNKEQERFNNRPKFQCITVLKTNAIIILIIYTRDY